MSIEKISPIGDDKDKKTGKASSPDSEAFREMMKVGKSREVDLDERSKRRLPRQEEEEIEEPTTSQPTAAEIYYYREQEKNKVPDQLPSSHTLVEADSPKVDPKKKAKMIETLENEIKKEKKEPAKILEAPPIIPKKVKGEKPFTPPPSIKKEKEILQKPQLKTPSHAAPSEKGEKIKEAPLLAPVPAAKTPKEEKKVKKEEEIYKAEGHGEKIKAKKAKIPAGEEKTEIASFTLPPDIVTQTQSIVAKAEPLLNQEIVPVFEHIVGTIMYIEQKGITTTTVILDNPKFSASRFYGAKITFEQYSTNPTSYNIRLTGSQEAVTIFNDNLEGLYKSLKNADLDFEVGRIWAEYESQRPLFRRKPKAGDIGKEAENG